MIRLTPAPIFLFSNRYFVLGRTFERTNSISINVYLRDHPEPGEMRAGLHAVPVLRDFLQPVSLAFLPGRHVEKVGRECGFRS